MEWVKALNKRYIYPSIAAAATRSPGQSELRALAPSATPPAIQSPSTDTAA